MLAVLKNVRITGKQLLWSPGFNAVEKEIEKYLKTFFIGAVTKFRLQY